MFNKNGILLLVMCCSLAFGQLIIDEDSEWGKKMIAKMMTAINLHEDPLHEKLTFVTVVSVLGKEGNYEAFLTCKNADNKKFSCTCDLLAHGEDDYEVGTVHCTNDDKY